MVLAFPGPPQSPPPSITSSHLPVQRLTDAQRLTNHSPTMLTKYLTAITTTFSPFNPRSGKTARNFLALLPPNARSTMAIDIKMLGQAGARAPATLGLKFKDGKEMTIDLGKTKLKEIQMEVDRHSRGLKRAEELAG